MTPRGAPVLFVKKQDYSMRLYIDDLGFDKVTLDNSMGAPVLFVKKMDSSMRLCIDNLGFRQCND